MHEPIGTRTYWFTPDGDGWSTKSEAIETFRANHNGEPPAWVQRVDETAHSPEAIAPKEEQ